MNAAAMVRQSKEKYPADFCPVKGCLWRVKTRDGYKPCAKHERSEATPCGEGSSDRAETQSEEASPVAVPLRDSRPHDRQCTCPKCVYPF